MSALVILCGVLGGLISMLRRLQALPAGSTPLFDTIALNASQFGIGLAPIYGGIFARVLYLVFLSGVLDTVIAPRRGTQLVPDVLNRLTARKAASPAKSSGAPSTAPSGPA